MLTTILIIAIVFFSTMFFFHRAVINGLKRTLKLHPWFVKWTFECRQKYRCKRCGKKTDFSPKHMHWFFNPHSTNFPLMVICSLCWTEIHIEYPNEPKRRKEFEKLLDKANAEYLEANSC